MSNQHFQFDKFIVDLEEREKLRQERLERLTAQERECHYRTLDKRYRESAHQRMVIRGNDEG